MQRCLGEGILHFMISCSEFWVRDPEIRGEFFHALKKVFLLQVSLGGVILQLMSSWYLDLGHWH